MRTVQIPADIEDELQEAGVDAESAVLAFIAALLRSASVGDKIGSVRRLELDGHILALTLGLPARNMSFELDQAILALIDAEIIIELPGGRAVFRDMDRFRCAGWD